LHLHLPLNLPLNLPLHLNLCSDPEHSLTEHTGAFINWGHRLFPVQDADKRGHTQIFFIKHLVISFSVPTFVPLFASPRLCVKSEMPKNLWPATCQRASAFISVLIRGNLNILPQVVNTPGAHSGRSLSAVRCKFKCKGKASPKSVIISQFCMLRYKYPVVNFSVLTFV